MLKTITNVLASAIFETAHVILTDCDHRHVRPNSMRHEIGDDFNCPFCDDDAVDTGLTTRQLFRKMRAAEWNAIPWEAKALHPNEPNLFTITRAIETANEIHALHNPHLIPVGYNAFATRYEIRDAARQLADRIDQQCLDRLMVEMSEHWPNLPTPRMGAKIEDP